MRVVITGGSGLIGSEVARDLGGAGHEVVILTRDPAKAGPLPANTRATLGVRMHGNVQLDSELPLTMTSDGRSGRRSLYTVGGGGAQVEVETFDGAVRIRRP